MYFRSQKGLTGLSDVYITASPRSAPTGQFLPISEEEGKAGGGIHSRENLSVADEREKSVHNENAETQHQGREDTKKSEGAPPPPSLGETSDAFRGPEHSGKE
ncbi:unnamed protein product [Rangifer tarandus platyrhynchus]|uniref:Uncharacterized protein n=1 Tax=Rangifer tarandus platyrhynchus TaxID=3082113 RepID=A0AC59Y384_RANTA